MAADSSRRGITWDEQTLAAQSLQRGVEYGTMKIEHPDTPFLYYDEAQSRGDDKQTVCEMNLGQGTKEKLSISEMQDKLELTECLAKIANQSEDERFPGPKFARVDTGFGAQRTAHYGGEVELARLSTGLLPGWKAMYSRSEPREAFYYNEESG